MARAPSVCNVEGCTARAVRGGKCETCASKADVARGSAAMRGYDYEHRMKRARLLPRAYGRPCAICTRIMRKGQPLDLHHIVALRDNRQAKLSDMAHRSCNLGSDPPFDPAYDEGS
jgi:hypothetical protein